MSSNAPVRRRWTKEEDRVLRREAEYQLSQGALKNWNSIADKLPKRTNKDCRKRWSKVCEPVKKGAWSSAENERLRNAVSQYGQQWILVAQSVESRHADQCAKRWRHALDPNIDHSEWTEDEDKRLVNAVKQFGHNWRSISNKEFPSRSTTDIKNRHVLINRKQQGALPIPESPSTPNQVELQEDSSEDGDEDEVEDEDEDEDRQQHGFLNELGFEDFLGTASNGNSSANVPPTYTPQEILAVPDEQGAAFNILSLDHQQHHYNLFSIPQDNDFPFSTPSTEFLWEDRSMITSQGGTGNASDATATPESFNQSQVCLGPEQGHLARGESTSGSTLILEDVQPETVSLILTTLSNSRAKFRMRLESKEN